MRQQNVIVFSSGKNKRVAHGIARWLDGGVCKAVVWDEFFNKIYGDEYTLTKSYALFPHPRKGDRPLPPHADIVSPARRERRVSRDSR